MRIYSLSPKDEVQRLDVDLDLRVEILRSLGTNLPWKGDWPSPRAWRMEIPRKRKAGLLCDWTSVGAAEGLPALSARAKAVLEPMLQAKAQWLPLAFDEGEYWLLNCLNAPDVLDIPASSIARRPDDSISSIDEFAFKPSAVGQELLFKVPGAPNSIFATDHFRDLAEQQGLKGLFYQPVWDSEHAPFKPLPGRGDILKRPEIYGPEGFVPNVQELWPAEWKERAREMKKRSGEAKAMR